MKRSLFLTLCLISGLSAFAGGLDQKLVPANAKWLLHLDGEAFRKTKIGAMIIEERCETEVRKAEREAKAKFDFSFKKITALTAFGTLVGDQNDGVLIVETTADVRGDLSKLIALRELNGGNTPPVSKLHNNGIELYKFGPDLNLMPAGSNLWLLGKNKTSLEAAREVVLGKAPSLSNSAFLKAAAGKDSFLFAAADTGSAGARLPAQARILQNADSGQFEVGEKDGQLRLLFTLRSKDADTVVHITEVLKGLRSLVALTTSQDKDLSTLLNSASFASTDGAVVVTLRFPVPRAIEKIRDSN